MNRCAMLGGIFLLAVTSTLVGDSPAAKMHQVQLGVHTFTLPVGFEIEPVAGPPLVNRPIVADFDEQGRLYVADSSGSNDKVDVQLQKKPHRVVRLEDSKGDGRFDQQKVFADQLMFPEGAMWYAGSLYVSGPPSIWKLTDTDGDGVADQRTEWFQGKTLTGCANDLHGPYLGPDGWIYWCKGAFARQTYERYGGGTFATRAAHMFRARPDGTGIEPVMTGGMDNPVEVAFTPGGERIFTTTFLQHPGGGRRDGLIHAVYGGIYGKDHDPIYDHPWTSPELMPVLTHLGPAAPCGLTRYESNIFGPEYQDNLFACQFNMHKVSRHILEPAGATFKSRDEDFLVSNNLDFHPTDVLEDADGSLLVLNTGGWYKICCPTSQLHKPDILGAIYRIRRTGAPRVDDPRGLKIAWTKLSAAELAALLGDPRPAVRHRAIAALATAPEGANAAANVLSSSASVEARRNAVWALTRIDRPEARRLARRALEDADETVRQTAIHSASVGRDQEARETLLRLLQNESLHNRRAAAEALGRLRNKEAVPALLEAIGHTTDRVLQHSLTYAVIEIGDRNVAAAGLDSKNLAIHQAAMIALNGMKDGKLSADVVAKDLTSPDGRTKEIAAWIAGRHPEWGGTLAGFFREQLKHLDSHAPQWAELAQRLARFAAAPAIQDLLAEQIDPNTPSQAQRCALRAIAQANLKETPASWIQAVTKALGSTDADVVNDAVLTARALPAGKQRPEGLINALLTLAGNPQTPDALRLNALAAVPGGITDVKPDLLRFLGQHLDRDAPAGLRAAAADVLAHAHLTADQLVALAEMLKTVGPMELDRVLEPFGNCGDERVGRALLTALAAAQSRASLRIDALKQRLTKYGPSVQKQAAELYAILDADAAKQRAHLEQLLASISNGDIRRGQAVFNGTKAACSTCHAVGYLGGNIGPDLTRIGSIRTERDLLESIVFPSASFVRSYEPVVVTTKDGKIYNGLIKKESLDEILLVLNATQEVRVPRDTIEDMQPSKVSIMPAGLDQQLSVQELADLVAFLKACK